MHKKDNVAVIGGGVFGCTAAIMLSREGFGVTLFEKNGDIMQAASAINQYRIHKGYHYPRSPETISSCLHSASVFENEYSEAVIKKHEHYYGISKSNSFVSGEKYISILEKHKLPYEIVCPTHINQDAVDMVILADENLFDPDNLRKIIKERLTECKVKVKLNTKVNIRNLDNFEYIVNAGYAGINSAFDGMSEAKKEYQFEVCEKIVIGIPKELEGISTVIMDGPFMSYDPLGDTGHAVMGHVDHAICAWNIGFEPEIPSKIKPFLNKGIIKNPPISNWRLFTETGAHYIPALRKVKYIGSMFTVRTVLPKVEDTDTRPTIVNSIDDRAITIYSGKIGTCVNAAKDVLSIIEGRED